MQDLTFSSCFISANVALPSYSKIGSQPRKNHQLSITFLQAKVKYQFTKARWASWPHNGTLYKGSQIRVKKTMLCHFHPCFSLE